MSDLIANSLKALLKLEKENSKTIRQAHSSSVFVNRF